MTLNPRRLRNSGRKLIDFVRDYRQGNDWLGLGQPIIHIWSVGPNTTNGERKWCWGWWESKTKNCSSPDFTGRRPQDQECYPGKTICFMESTITTIRLLFIYDLVVIKRMSNNNMEAGYFKLSISLHICKFLRCVFTISPSIVFPTSFQTRIHDTHQSFIPDIHSCGQFCIDGFFTINDYEFWSHKLARFSGLHRKTGWLDLNVGPSSWLNQEGF